MTFDREPDLDNANVGIPEQKRKSGKLPNRWLSFLFYCEKLWNIAGKTVAEYLAETNYDPKRIAVERNGDIVPKAQYETAVLADGDSVEVVSFVGGG